MGFFQQRLPHRREILYTFGTSVFVIFSWSLRGFFDHLPSFLQNQKPAVVFAIFCYMMAFALLESLLLTGSFLLASIILPGNWFKEGFAYKSFLIILIITVTSIRLQLSLKKDWPSKEALLPGFGIAILVLILLIVLAYFFTPLQKLLLDVQDRMQIFLYIYIPIGILGILVVFIRNLG